MPGVNLTNMTPIRSWEEARAHWEANRPIRARVQWPADSVALDGPRKPHVRLRYTPHTEQYSCMLYDTPLVSYYPNGVVTVILDYRRASTDFLRKVLPAGLEVIRAARGVWLEVNLGTDEKAHVRQVMPDGVLLRSCTPGTWSITGPVRHREVVLVQHRKIAGLEKRCTSVREWLRAVHRLAGAKTLRKVKLTDPPQDLEDALDDPQKWNRFVEYAPIDVVAAVAASSGVIKVVGPTDPAVRNTRPINPRWARRLPSIAHYLEMAFL